MLRVEYKIYIPAGNDTALVRDNSFTNNEKILINNLIINKHPNVEQVGFIYNNKDYYLKMAGGEFCGNAIRCAAFEFLSGKSGVINIETNSNTKVLAGVDSNKNSWCEINLSKKSLLKLDNDIYTVEFDGIKFIVILDVDYEGNNGLKDYCKNIISKYDNKVFPAIGVILLNKKNSNYYIKPVVLVRNINTFFFESACGSGSIAAAMVLKQILEVDEELKIFQHSGLFIKTKVNVNNNEFRNAIISSKIKTNNKTYYLEI